MHVPTNSVIATIGRWRIPREVERAKQFLRVFEHGGKLDSAVVGDLYLVGYIEIDLQSCKKELHLTTITAKGKQLLCAT